MRSTLLTICCVLCALGGALGADQPPAATMTTVAGTGEVGYAGDGGPAVKADLTRPESVATDRAGNLVITDSGNSRVRVVTH